MKNIIIAVSFSVAVGCMLLLMFITAVVMVAVSPIVVVMLLAEAVQKWAKK